ncbi:MAG: hypothetical protein IT359_13460 [Gemmatimonadaceae bacterium]|nr:hypothetical protein [Gemmatimonadaceae bacterium]
MRLLNIAPAAALLAALALPAGAQQARPATPASSTALPVTPGARVRVSATTLVAPLIGNFLEMRGDTAVFIEAGAGRGIWTLTTDQITRLEISKGDERYNRKPMLKGAAIGAPAGALLFWGVTGLLKPSDKSRQYDRGVTAGVGLVVGGVVGAIVGSRFADEGWMRLPLPGRVSWSPTVRDGRQGVGLRVGLTF